MQPSSSFFGPAAVDTSGAPEPSASAIVVRDEVASHDLTINGYSRTKDLRPGEFFSSSFAAAGHRWSLRYYSGGMDHVDPDSSQWIWIFLHLDESHAPDVKARFTLTLLDAIGRPVPSCSYTSTWVNKFVPGGEGTGCRFIDRKCLQQSPHLWRDCFSVRCDIAVAKEHSDPVAGRPRPGPFVAVPPPAGDTHSWNLGLSVNDAAADVAFVVQGERISAHRSVLARRSPVFRALLFGPMKESAGSADGAMVIEDMEARVFKALLHFIYTDTFPVHGVYGKGEQEMAMVQHLLVAADMYGVERLKLMCEHRLCSNIATTSVGTILALAEQHDCRGLKEACFHFLMALGNLKAAVATDGFEHLTNSCPSVLRELLSKIAL